MNVLMYTILVKEPHAYIPMLNMLLKSLQGHMSPCDFLMIGNADCLHQASKIDRPRSSGKCTRSKSRPRRTCTTVC